MNAFRCTAPAHELDSDKWHVHRSQAHTELLVESFELGVVWDEYGLVGDVVVGFFFLLSLSKSNSSLSAVHQCFSPSGHP